MSVYQTDIILYGNDLTDYIHHEFAGQSSSLLAHATVDFWSYFVEGGPGIDVTSPTPFTPYAVTAQEAVDCIRMLALERLIGRRHHPYQLVEAGLTALVLDVETESLPLLAGLSRSEHEQADAFFDQVLGELGLLQEQGWGALARPQQLKPLVEKTDAYNDWAAIRQGDREHLAEQIVEEAGRLLDGPWPPLD
ncbi:hypothetical protein [Streptomyces wedmorensis]|uniref:hypothetical protein n=1 Tax=Streptomyces wedmorensis TaxID=43759 RepID=UPI000A5690EA|nr:hypothetical protein [Streptomyces wedmorensis]